jgi:hypothetical protein
MNINRLLFLILVFCPCCIIAQEKSDSLLYKIFRAKNNSDLFAGVDVIKKAKKDNINAEIKALSISSRTEIIKSADLAQSAPWTMLTWSQFNEFKITGNRVNYEKNYFSRRNKLSRLIIGELVAKD